MSREYHQKKYAPPPGAADLLLIRHGRTEAARPGVSFPMVDGHGDPALHPEGEEQALGHGSIQPLGNDINPTPFCRKVSSLPTSPSPCFPTTVPVKST